eukprot:CAMPEP_0113730340 /NCGR_PEP_ID=MMETSP0038_2-20120614/43102_1 /TAXON_ID=2898 /ORGANISM="Cryptomonas paramecium" /LENGTH=79 /DNA_ID=CAMNT_0000662385 /DNA_START=42 /DNA_END=281 /DNA_ORIENTATION=- /assembly_acc=CAM_ASM_000170
MIESKHRIRKVVNTLINRLALCAFLTGSTKESHERPPIISNCASRFLGPVRVGMLAIRVEIRLTGFSKHLGNLKKHESE